VLGAPDGQLLHTDYHDMAGRGFGRTFYEASVGVSLLLVIAPFLFMMPWDCPCTLRGGTTSLSRGEKLMMRSVYQAIACGVLAALAVFPVSQPLSVGQAQTTEPGEGRPTKSASEPRSTKHTEDEAAIRKATVDFIKEVEQGDAKAVAASWTEDGEYIGEGGQTIQGRTAIEAAYAKGFAANKKLKVENTIESIRFPAKDTAIEEGRAKSYKGDAKTPSVARYSVLYVREEGHWLIAQLREWPEEGVSLSDLDWLIGTWEAKTREADVRTTYAWDANKNSIRCHITIKGKDRDLSGVQIILKDPRTGQLRSWLFADDGSFGDGAWAYEGKGWGIAASGVEADGSELTARNLLTPIDKDSFTWQSTERTLDGEVLPNIPPIKVVRVK
jgi:uncharacterized protein (TIGR02246 family)